MKKTILVAIAFALTLVATSCKDAKTTTTTTDTTATKDSCCVKDSCVKAVDTAKKVK